MINAILDIMNEILSLFIQMAPYLLFGFIISGLLYVLIPRSFIIKHLKPNKTSSIFKAAVLGVPLPLCSCAVIPVAAHLRKQGANKSATVSFLASTPSTGADSIIATYSLMGPVYAVFRPIDALFSGLLAGLLVKAFTPKLKVVNTKQQFQVIRFKPIPKTDVLMIRKPSPSHYLSTSRIGNVSNKQCRTSEISSCGSSDTPEISPCCSSETPEVSPCSSNEAPEVSSCCSNDAPEKEQQLSPTDKIKKAIHYGLFELVNDTKKWILIGIIVGGVLSWGIPSGLASYWIDYPVLSYLSMLAIGLPMYVCATASIPIATALLLNGLTPGAALVFLAVGPATNTATIAFLNSSMGKRNMLIYLFSISFSAIFLGVMIDIFYGEALMGHFQTMAHIDHAGFMDYLFSAVLAGLILIQFIKGKFPSINKL